MLKVNNMFNENKVTSLTSYVRLIRDNSKHIYFYIFFKKIKYYFKNI